MTTSISERKNAKGISSFTAQIRIREKGVEIHSESSTHARRPAAQAWLKKRSRELEDGGLEDIKNPKRHDPTLGEVIQKYMESLRKQAGKTKLQVLNTIKNDPISELPCSAITSQHILKFAKNLGSQPQTVGNYLSHLASVIKIARPAWGFPIDYQVIKDAKEVAKHLGITGRSNQRTRRPTLDEIDKLLTFFKAREKRDARTIPMSEIIYFGLFSTRRQAEICRLTFADFDEKHSEMMVRDMKNPGEKIGNDVRTRLPDEAVASILRRRISHKQKDDRIFPFNSDTVSRTFTETCVILGIEDLHFHDLRHEGISRLFEMGWSIPNVAQVSGHRTWTSLKRYTQLHQEGDKYQDWAWHEGIKYSLGVTLENRFAKGV